MWIYYSSDTTCPSNTCQQQQMSNCGQVAVTSPVTSVQGSPPPYYYGPPPQYNHIHYAVPPTPVNSQQLPPHVHYAVPSQGSSFGTPQVSGVGQVNGIPQVLPGQVTQTF